jgi:uncharacterized protein (DUF433 family)
MNIPDFLTRDDLGGIRLTGHRIGLEHVVLLYGEGYSPEMLWDEFPTISLALIHKVIAFYLENRIETDAYVARCQAGMEELRKTAKREPNRVDLRERLEAKRRAEAVQAEASRAGTS